MIKDVCVTVRVFREQLLCLREKWHARTETFCCSLISVLHTSEGLALKCQSYAFTSEYFQLLAAIRAGINCSLKSAYQKNLVYYGNWKEMSL
jgi:hypothetical protein